jgi:iron complex outermembrane receptor protein
LKGRLVTGGITHDLSFGVLISKVKNRLPMYANNFVGTGNVEGTAVVPEDPTLAFPAAQRDERSVELSVADSIRWNERLSTWIGLRHTHLNRGYTQSITTPWAAASYKLAPNATAYLSYGQGVESQQVPNNAAIYSNPSAVLPALKSRQWEAGLKGEQGALAWQLAAFRIARPVSNIEYCTNTLFSGCTGQYDGKAVHQGIEASSQWAQGPWRIGAALSVLDARRKNSVLQPGSNGKRPPNVPDWTLRAQAGWKVAAVPGLEVQGQLAHEGKRSVLPDESVRLPAWTRLDASLRYDTKLAGTATTWSLGVDNITNKRYWKESPSQFGHVYLYPGAPRTLRLSLTAAL